MKLYYSYEEIKEQRKIDIEERARMWERVVEDAGGGERGQRVADAIKDLYTLFDPRLAVWCASLYDKNWGSFYASPIGRDTEGFIPDLESTHQMFSFIEGSGMLNNYDGSCRKGLPDWMIAQVMYYAKAIQDENGYFYHPNWAKECADELISHRGRDLTRCTMMLKDFGTAPVYDTPNGYKGDGIGADEYWISLGRTDSPPPAIAEIYRSRKKQYNPKAVAANTGNTAKKQTDDGTGYLSSHTAYIDYILDTAMPRMHSGPYSMGNEFNATYTQIKVASDKLGPYKYSNTDGEKYARFDGMTLVEITITSLNENINPETGLWGDLTEKTPLGTEFAYINGFMKTIFLYNSWQVPYPERYLNKVANALMDGILGSEESPYNICAIYNVWTSVAHFKANLKYLKNEEKREEILAGIMDILLSKAPDAIRNTKYKLAKYKKEDGGFGHGYSYSSSASTHQGLPVSTGDPSSDVDATVIGADHMLAVMFSSLNLKKPPILMPSDWMRCRNILENAPPVVKKSTQNVLQDFEHKADNFVRKLNSTITPVDLKGNRAIRISTEVMGGGVLFDLTAALFRGKRKLFEVDLMLTENGKSVDISLVTSKRLAVATVKLAARDGNMILVGCGRGIDGEYTVGKLNEMITLGMEYTTDDNFTESYIKVHAGDYRGEMKVCSDDGELIPGYPANAIQYWTALLDGAGEIYADNLSFYLAE